MAHSSALLPAPRDVGAIDGPLLVCGGAYSNLEAFGAMLAEAGRRGIPAARIIHTGDVVAYCGDPLETAMALRDSGIHTIQGNVEEQLAGDGDDCGCGFEEGTACDVLSRHWYAHARAAISPEIASWMGAMPVAIAFELGGRRFRVVHGGVGETSRFLFASSPVADLGAEMHTAGADAIIAGHSGLPFTREIGGRVWHNAGALGMPANDGTARVWCSVISDGVDGVCFEPVPLTYDHAGAARIMRRRGLPDGYAEALETGLWPSLDVLPPEERAATGIPLTPRPFHWRHRVAADARPAPQAVSWSAPAR